MNNSYINLIEEMFPVCMCVLRATGASQSVFFLLSLLSVRQKVLQPDSLPSGLLSLSQLHGVKSHKTFVHFKDKRYVLFTFTMILY